MWLKFKFEFKKEKSLHSQKVQISAYNQVFARSETSIHFSNCARAYGDGALGKKRT